ncbi:hypothetical protein Forpi1262_v014319 [Fusarium oxysporum f. sp. raphani]|uniref:ABA 3 protein n=1 Tax=Fusarium oxysporum f. sp. raphani TaxID=96318 RepID=A0A8J5PHZ9_FUSOX|nr:hypothetical protein Forpi1262_v014319 [Fusarium oxysporum f. sp. raphani]KAH7461088.1 hypothetical protein FOMA001_g19153 [Fusarium oxysporum f. sp. matthiolae]
MSNKIEHQTAVNVSNEKWYFPQELRDGLQPFNLSSETIAETLACAWEYSRCVIPNWTSWERYLAFNRTIIIAIVAEFRGDLIPEINSKNIIGYDVDELLSTLFGGTSMREDMSREFRTFLLMSAEKSRKQRDSELFGRYLNALAKSPQWWFRLRDCDALARYTIASALACNGFSEIPFREEQLQLVAELSDTLYDAVAFYKHRAEGETNSTFGYVGSEMRVENYREYREILWALDVKWAHDPAKRCVLNFIRPFGGPIHMMTRRYRFVEDGLMIGRPETDQVVELTRANFKLWHKVDSDIVKPDKDGRYMDTITKFDKLMLPGFCGLLESSARKHCSYCSNAVSSSLDIRRFGGVRLCDECKANWRSFMRAARARFAAAFPEIKEEVLKGWQCCGSSSS